MGSISRAASSVQQPANERRAIMACQEHVAPSPALFRESISRFVFPASASRVGRRASALPLGYRYARALRHPVAAGTRRKPRAGFLAFCSLRSAPPELSARSLVLEWEGLCRTPSTCLSPRRRRRRRRSRSRVTVGTSSSLLGDDATLVSRSVTSHFFKNPLPVG